MFADLFAHLFEIPIRIQVPLFDLLQNLLRESNDVGITSDVRDWVVVLGHWLCLVPFVTLLVHGRVPFLRHLHLHFPPQLGHREQIDVARRSPQMASLEALCNRTYYHMVV